MLSIKIDNPELEKSIQHVAISIEQLDSGQKKSLHDVMKAVRSKCEP